MKKRLIFALLLTAALLALTACSGSSAPDSAATPDAEASDAAATPDAEAPDAAELTMRDILDANSGETVFQSYGSLLKTYQYPDDPDGRAISAYSNGDFYLEDHGEEQYLLPRDGSNVYLHDAEGYAAILEFGYDPSPIFRFPLLDESLTLQEEIASVTEDAGAGTLSLVTRLSVEAYRDFYPEGEFPYQEGDFHEESYLLDASDYRILETASALVRADGTRDEESRMTVAYGAPEPEAFAELLAHKTAADARTGTVTLDPNTPQERSATAVAQKGDAILTYLPEGYENLYLDPECTELNEPKGDYNADFHFYSKPEE